MSSNGVVAEFKTMHELGLHLEAWHGLERETRILHTAFVTGRDTLAAIQQHDHQESIKAGRKK